MKDDKFQYITCRKCGWVSFTVTYECADFKTKSFLKYYNTLGEKDQKECYGDRKQTYKSVFIEYVGCNLCGSSDFRKFRKGDCLDGCTIGPAIWEFPQRVKKKKKSKKS